MTGLWNELAKRLADQWFSLLVLPGALYVGVAGAAGVLGYSHALNLAFLVRHVTAYATNPDATTIAGQIVLLAALLGAASAIGLLAQTLGAATERVALAADWPTWHLPLRAVARWRTRRRQQAWGHADRDYKDQHRKALAPEPADRPDPALRRRAAMRRDRIAVEPPERPTWSGDRINAAAVRLDRDYYLDLATVWPALWLVLPDNVRDQISTSRASLARAHALYAWALLYLAIGVQWWPAIPLASVIAATAHHKVRAATDTYAALLETAARLHTTALAEQLRIEHTGPLNTRLGEALTHRLRGQRPPATDQAGAAKD
jgi:hypothetical protein